MSFFVQLYQRIIRMTRIFDRSSLKSKFKTVKTRKQIMHDLFVEYQDQIDIVLFETGSL